MSAPYIYYQIVDSDTPGNYRIWLAGSDRGGVFRTAESFSVTTDNPAAWLADNQVEALDRLDAGRASIVRIATGMEKQLDRREQIAWQEIRAERDDRLAASDWTRTAPQFSERLRELYAAYQQTLRDIPGTYPTPYDVIWPAEPTEDDVPVEPPDWKPTYDRIKTLAQSAVGVDLGDLDNAQIKALLAVLLHEAHAFGPDGTIRPLGEWVKRRV